MTSRREDTPSFGSTDGLVNQWDGVIEGAENALSPSVDAD
jgi:hypothetical protein